MISRSTVNQKREDTDSKDDWRQTVFVNQTSGWVELDDMENPDETFTHEQGTVGVYNWRCCSTPPPADETDKL